MSFYTGFIAAASNRADFLFSIELIDRETNDTVDLVGSTVTVAMRPVGKNVPAVSGTNLDGHVTLTTPGAFEVKFSRAEMSQFAAGELDIGITVLLLVDGNTYQLFAGQVPVVDGVVA